MSSEIQTVSPETILQNYNWMMKTLNQHGGKGKFTTPERKAEIIGLIEKGLKNYEIAFELKCDRRTVRKIRKALEDGDLQ